MYSLRIQNTSTFECFSQNRVEHKTYFELEVDVPLGTVTEHITLLL